MLQRVALSGLLCSGKDFVANSCGFRPVSIAEPIYRLYSHFFGPVDKSREDCRRFLQTVGQWGWGCPESLQTAERALWAELIQRRGQEITGMNGPWHQFGLRKDFWIEIMRISLENSPKNDRLAITNCRFEHEHAPLTAAGFSHYLVLCREETRIKRYGKQIPPSVNNDTSEKFARKLAMTLPVDRIIWNDDEPQPMKGMYLSLEEFMEIACK